MNIFDNYENKNINKYNTNFYYTIINNDYEKYINLNIINNTIINKFNKKIEDICNILTSTENIIQIEKIIYNPYQNIENKKNYIDSDNKNIIDTDNDIFIVKKIKNKKKDNINTNNINTNNINTNNINTNTDNSNTDNINKLDLMNDLFENELHNTTKLKIKGDDLKITMSDFLNNCIMKSILRYDNKNNIYTMDILKLKNNIINYDKHIKNNDHIIFYEQYDKWYEINYTGIVKIENTNKLFNLCLKKLKNNNKFRKNYKNGVLIRGIKLTFIVLNKKIDMFYIKRNNNTNTDTDTITNKNKNINNGVNKIINNGVNKNTNNKKSHNFFF